MAYHVANPDDLDLTPDRPCKRWSIGTAVGLENMGLNLYEAAPGEQLPLKYHSHDTQEEAFYVLAGTLHVETPDGEFVAETGEVFIAEPDSPHRAFNPESASASVRALAVGAPPVDDVASYDPSEAAGKD